MKSNEKLSTVTNASDVANCSQLPCYTKEQFVEAVKLAFKQGQDWAETYSGWFTPKESQTQEKLKQAVRVISRSV